MKIDLKTLFTDCATESSKLGLTVLRKYGNPLSASERMDHLRKVCQGGKENRWDNDESATLCDTILGLNVIAEKGQRRVASKAGKEANWSESWGGADGYINQGYQTPYSWLYKQFTKMELTNQTLVDLGCGYGRVGWVLGAMFPNTKFIGYDIEPRRVKEVNRVAKELGLTNVEARCQDLSDKTIPIVQADIYFTFNPFNAATFKIIFGQRLAAMAAKKPFMLLDNRSGVGPGTCDCNDRYSTRHWLRRVEDGTNPNSPFTLYKTRTRRDIVRSYGSLKAFKEKVA